MADKIIIELWYLIRVLVSILIGLVIGAERKYRQKEAGRRTHAVVCGGACLIMLISKYGFGDSPNFDGSRVAAQIVSGIGFLGAGMILYKKESLHGLTTAAGIWMTAGVGMSIGAGMYILGAGSAAMIILCQFLLHIKLKPFVPKRYYILRIKFRFENEENEIIKQIFDVKDYIKINFISMGNGYTVDSEIHMNENITDDRIGQIIKENSFISSIEKIETLGEG